MELDRLERLGREVALEQDEMLAKQEMSWDQLRVQPFRPPRRTVRGKRPALLIACAAAAALLVLAARAWMEARSPLEVHVAGQLLEHPHTWIDAPGPETVPVRLSDGTRIVIEPGSRARLFDVTHAGAHLAFENGGAEVSVVPRRGSRYRLSLGHFEVRVTGTRFTVRWSPEDDLFELQLIEGAVTVSGCTFGAGRPVQEGETVRASCRSGRFEISHTGLRDGPEAPAPEPAASPAEGEPHAPAAAPTSRAKAPPPTPPNRGREAQREAPSWLDLARDGQYAEAFKAAQAAGFARECDRASPEGLRLLADTARLSGHSTEAQKAYLALRRRFPASPAAAHAAFELGRIAFDGRGAHAEAARWLRTYLVEEPGGRLSREARGRLMEALYRSGDAAGARAAAERYLGAYPDGPHVPLARELISNDPR